MDVADIVKGGERGSLGDQIEQRVVDRDTIRGPIVPEERPGSMGHICALGFRTAAANLIFPTAGLAFIHEPWLSFLQLVHVNRRAPFV